MNEIVKVTDLSQTFYTKEGEPEVLKDINFSLNEGQILTLLGLSGGMRQRVALIRTLAVNPDYYFLMSFWISLVFSTYNKIKDNLQKYNLS